MKKYFILLLMLSAVIYAQDKVDSILTANRNKTAGEKIELLNKFCWENRDSEPKLALKAAEIALNLSEGIEENSSKSKTLNYLSVIYRDQGEYEKSMTLANRGLEIAQRINGKAEEAYSYNNISTIYRLMGSYPAAIEKLFAALEIFESIKDSVGIGYCYYNLGLVYLRWERFDNALENFEKTVKLRERLKDSEGGTKALGRIAEIYLQQGKDEEANKLFVDLERSFSNLKDQRGLINIRSGFAELYERKKDYANAIKQRLLALNISKNIKDVAGIVANTSELGVLYAMVGNFEEGKRLLEEGKAVAERHNSSALKLTNYRSYSDFYELQRDYTNAFKFSKLFRQQQDSLRQLEKSTAMNEVEAAYRMSKQEKEKENLKRDNEEQKNRIKYILLIAALSIGIAAFAVVQYIFKRRTSEKLKELNATKDKFFSIIAHDLKNPITTQFGLTSLLIEDYYEMKDDERLELIKSVDNAGKQTYKLLENLLYWSRSQTGRLDFTPVKINLSEIVKDCLSLLLENARFKKIELVQLSEKDIYAFADEDMIKTVVRNLISNAIKYSPNGSTIKISMEEKGKEKIISVIDKGIGISAGHLAEIFKVDAISSVPGTNGERGTGLGLVLCKEFVEKNGGNIWIESEPGKGSTFSFSLPSNEILK